MASSGGGQVAATHEDEDIRGDGKKKKFKPLSAVKKLFTGRSKQKKKENVVSKAKSTTALHSGHAEDDEDDDGGFKSHQSKAGPTLAGSRSISEDSVFNPNAPLSGFPTSAVSAESVPQVQFQSELRTKLNNRRSQYSDDDHDEGLPRSPVPPPITTADVINGEYLKPVTSDKRRNNQGSEQSLISVDSSENEEDNLFSAKWKHSVPAKRTGKMSDGSTPSEPLDFSQIQKTELLSSSVAKDRISIKPTSRRASRLSRKQKETSKSLPSLNEESPLKFRADSDSSTKRYDIDMSPTSALDISTGSASKQPIPVLSTSAPSYGMMAAAAPLKESHLDKSQKMDSKGVEDTKKDIEPKTDDTEAERPKNVFKSSIKGRAASFETSSSSSKVTETPKESGSSLKVSDPTSNIVSSPREDYKLKRQNRSKTIPAGNAEEANATKIHRASSDHLQSPMKEEHTSEEVPSTNESPKTQTPVSGNVKRFDASKFSKQEPQTSNTSEPAWMSMVRKKKEEQSVKETEKEADETSKNVDSKPLATAVSSSVNETKSTFTSVKSVFNSNTSQDKKRGSNVKSNSKVGENATDGLKKEGNSKDTTSSKRPSIDIGTMKRDSVEINVSELGSVKAMTSSFTQPVKKDNISSKSTSNDDNKITVPSSSSTTTHSTPSMAERAKLFSGASMSSSTPSSTPTGKPPSGGTGISRFGSVKTSPTKSVEAKSVFAGRGGSVKAMSSSSSAASASSTSSATKPETISSSPKIESQSPSSETKAVTSSANNIGSSAISVSATRPPLHPNSSSSSSTPSNSKVSPTSPPNQSKSSFVKPVPIGVKSSPFAFTKPAASTPASASSISSSSVVSSSSPSSSSSVTSSSSSSATTVSSSQIKTSPIRSHSSFTTSPAFKPQISSTPSPNYSRSNALTKSPSMKTPSNVAPKKEEKEPAKVPAWRANLGRKEVKIEIIEKNSSTPSSNSSSLSSSSQNKNENGKKIGDTSRVAEMTKTTETRSTPVTGVDKTARRSSKVLDLVKNFQNLQVSS